jgi:hypothetical protein
VTLAEDAGVPVMAPVEVFIESPLGSDGEIDKLTDGLPPDDVTGVNDVAVIAAVRVSAAIARVVESAVETEKANVFALVAPFASVAVTV